MTTSEDVKGTAFQRDTPDHSQHPFPSSWPDASKAGENPHAMERQAWQTAYGHAVDLQRQAMDMRGLTTALRRLLFTLSEMPGKDVLANLQPALALSRILDKLWDPHDEALTALEVRCYDSLFFKDKQHPASK